VFETICAPLTRILLAKLLIHNTKVFLTVVEAEEARVRGLARLVLGKGSLSGSQTATSGCVLTW
jgi:hypothetical protein